MEGKQDHGIWIIDAEAKTAYSNERMAEILGTSPAEMVGRAHDGQKRNESSLCSHLVGCETRNFLPVSLDASSLWIKG